MTVLGGVATAAVMVSGISSAMALEKVSMRLKWLTQAQFVGFYVAKAKGFYEEEGLDLTINPGGPNLNGESLVASGAENFAVAGGAENMLKSRAKGLPNVGIGMMLQRTPSAYIAHADSGIKSPQDFKGKTVSTFFTGAHNTLYAVLSKEGVAADDVKVVPQAVSLAPFVDRQVDVATVMMFNELIVLKNRGVDITVFEAEEYGVSFPSDTIITNETMIKDKPKVVQGFLNASIRGWKYAHENPEETIDILMEAAPSLDRAHQAAMLEGVSKLMVADKGTSEGIAVLDREKLEGVRAYLIEKGELPETVKLDDAMNTSFWAAVPDAYKKP
ncbi:Putative thiamine biosynthesis protein [Oceanibacterium hippocampi]|uniref:Thiamine pyrimidine synthase n=2 Tax=Oceanibacterium hippocampi TaxID=745714 RepID=A0A1Y5U2D3_9PROT|nr:Putative thiamine biosynthesis protein [Oceanibacterium hippocampi]